MLGREFWGPTLAYQITDLTLWKEPQLKVVPSPGSYPDSPASFFWEHQDLWLTKFWVFGLQKSSITFILIFKKRNDKTSGCDLPMPPLSYRCCRPVMRGHIPDRCVRVCLHMEALWRLQPAAAASAHCIATIGPFPQTNELRQRAQTETACMQITELLFTATIFEVVSPQRSNLHHVAHCETKSPSQQSAHKGPSSSPFWERRGPSRWGEGGREGCLEGSNVHISSLQG